MPDTKPADTKALEQLMEQSTVLKDGVPSHSALAAFNLMPSNLQFDVQHSEEQILLFLRQHFIVNVGWIVFSLLMLVLPPALSLFSVLSFLPSSFQLVLNLAWYLIIFGYITERFIVWYYSVYIVTTERIIDVDFYSLLFKKVSEAKLDRIEDITSSSGGVLASIFDYGNVTIQTAAEIPEIEFEMVPQPDKVSKLISELTEQNESNPNK